MGVWLAQCWQSLAGPNDPLLLGPVQNHALWESIVERSSRSTTLVQNAALASAAADAWQLVHAYELPWRQFGWPGEEFAAFGGWARSFEQACDERAVIDAVRLPDRLIERTAQLAGQRLLLAGFDEHPPQRRRLLDALAAAGVQIDHWQPAARRSRAVRLRASDPQNELLAAGRWVRRRLGSADDPPRIGLIVPDLHRRRAEVARHLSEMLTPAAELPGGDSLLAFNIAHGEPLSSQPIIDAAFAWLELLAGPLRWERVSVLLRTQYVAGAGAEADLRALLDADLRDRGFHDIPLAELLHQAEQLPRDRRCPLLIGLLQRVLSEERMLYGRHPAGYWSERIDAALDAAGWPGERTLSSAEYQTVQRWRRLLGEFASLDAILGHLAYRSALQRSRRLAESSLFQPETPPNAVDVLGWQDAAGLQFDHLWVAGLHDEDWPPAAEPNPLLPVSLQRRYGLPGSSAELCRQEAQRWLSGLQRVTGELVASWPAADIDRALRPSPLIEAWPEMPLSELAGEDPPRYDAALLGSAALEQVPDCAAPPLGTHAVRGGARVLALQAACPFRAFAERRLGAGELARPELGLEPMRRGVLAHRALELLWAGLGGSDGLMRLDPAAAAQRVEAAVERAWLDLRYAPRLPPRLARLERARLTVALESLLEIERQRPAFTVESLEIRREAAVGPLQLALRLDRIDRLNSGQRLLIDYKTGRATPRDWIGEQLIEPQLPLYAVTESSPVDGLAFARLRPGEIGYAGLAREAGYGPGWNALEASGAPGDWSELLQAWRQRLERLADGFARGDAAVDPAPGACQHCHLATLCRIHERGGRR